jgi:hypothetical protein
MPMQGVHRLGVRDKTLKLRRDRGVLQRLHKVCTHILF